VTSLEKINNALGVDRLEGVVVPVLIVYVVD